VKSSFRKKKCDSAVTNPAEKKKTLTGNIPVRKEPQTGRLEEEGAVSAEEDLPWGDGTDRRNLHLLPLEGRKERGREVSSILGGGRCCPE